MKTNPVRWTSSTTTTKTKRYIILAREVEVDPQTNNVQKEAMADSADDRIARGIWNTMGQQHPYNSQHKQGF